MTDNRRMAISAIGRSLDDAFDHIELNRDCSKYEVSDIIRFEYGREVAWLWENWFDKNEIEDN